LFLYYEILLLTINSDTNPGKCFLTIGDSSRGRPYKASQLSNALQVLQQNL